MFLFSSFYIDHLDLHSFPTRRSSDLYRADPTASFLKPLVYIRFRNSPASGPTTSIFPRVLASCIATLVLDRKSTRLNSSHEWISYAVFCLKKKTKTMNEPYDAIECST